MIAHMVYLIIPAAFFYLSYFILHTEHTSWPEMLVYPYLLNNGFTIYKDLNIPYTPIFIWFMQLIENVFGHSPLVTVGLVIALSFSTACIIFLVSNRIWKTKKLAGVCSVFYYLLWFFYFEGNGLWYEMFITPFLIGGFYFIYNYLFIKSHVRYIIFAAFLFSICFLSKQSAIWITLVSLAWMVLVKFKNIKILVRDVCFFMLAFFFPIVVTFLAAFFWGYLSNYWDWAYKFVFLVYPFTPGYRDFPSFVTNGKLLITLFVLVPFVYFYRSDYKKVWFGIMFIFATFMFAVPRWGLFHLQPLLAMLSIMAAPVLEDIWRSKVRFYKLILILFLTISIIICARQINRFFEKPIRFYEPDKYELNQKIKQAGYTNFFIFNSYDQLYVLSSNIQPVKPYIQNFAAFLEIEGMQKQLIEGIEQTKPRYILHTPYSGRGGYGPGDYRPSLVGDYIESHYILKEKLRDDLWVLERN